MRALVWIVEGSWEGCVDRARELLPADAQVTLLYVADADVERLVEHPGPGRLGRHPSAGATSSVRAVADGEARALLEAASQRLGRPAELALRRGHVEREVIEASEEVDLLVLARAGEPRREPRSLGRWTRFVVDHAGCAVLLVWDAAPPGADAVRWPPHLR